jgi:hypothetical protein
MSRVFTRDDLAQICALFEPVEAPWYSVAPDAVFRLQTRVPQGLKYQRVMILPGLSGQITSDDGKQVTVSYYEAKEWLKKH